MANSFDMSESNLFFSFWQITGHSLFFYFCGDLFCIFLNLCTWDSTLLFCRLCKFFYLVVKFCTFISKIVSLKVASAVFVYFSKYICPYCEMYLYKKLFCIFILDLPSDEKLQALQLLSISPRIVWQIKKSLIECIKSRMALTQIYSLPIILSWLLYFTVAKTTKKNYWLDVERIHLAAKF